MPPPGPIDPLAGPKLALAGRLVPMDDAFTVIPRGVLYIERGGIVAALDAEAPPPPGFAAVARVETRGTLFPGLIELHNHLAYNALPSWAVPRKFTNRDQWSGIDEYRKLISGPMQVVGKTPELLPAVIRYVEAKCLLGGTTTSQGIQLYSNAGVRRYYRGIVRNVEQTDEPDLPEAATRVADVEAQDALLFRARLLKQSCFLLHLSEGTDDSARKHFLALRVAPDEWAISKQLAGIHSAALTAQDFNLLGEKGGAMVWSPLSNLLLYGATARVKAARAAGVRIGIGGDWSPSGSKNLLGELKVARLVSEAAGGVFGDRELVAMATRTAAGILQWERVLGTLEAGKRADLLVVAGKTGDPYAALLEAAETSIRLVMINGVARYGTPTLMQRLGSAGERIRVGGRERMVYLEQATADPVVATIRLGDARDRIEDAFRKLPELARRIENPPPVPAAIHARRLRGEPEPLAWSLALDELHDTGVDLRPRLPLRGRTALTGPRRAAAAAARPLSQVLGPLDPDPLTVADDGDFFERLKAQPNLPAYVKDGLEGSY